MITSVDVMEGMTDEAQAEDAEIAHDFFESARIKRTTLVSLISENVEEKTAGNPLDAEVY